MDSENSDVIEIGSSSSSDEFSEYQGASDIELLSSKKGSSSSSDSDYEDCVRKLRPRPKRVSTRKSKRIPPAKRFDAWTVESGNEGDNDVEESEQNDEGGNCPSPGSHPPRRSWRSTRILNEIPPGLKRRIQNNVATTATSITETTSRPLQETPRKQGSTKSNDQSDIENVQILDTSPHSSVSQSGDIRERKSDDVSIYPITDDDIERYSLNAIITEAQTSRLSTNHSEQINLDQDNNEPLSFSKLSNSMELQKGTSTSLAASQQNSNHGVDNVNDLVITNESATNKFKKISNGRNNANFGVEKNVDENQTKPNFKSKSSPSSQYNDALGERFARRLAPPKKKRKMTIYSDTSASESECIILSETSEKVPKSLKSTKEINVITNQNSPHTLESSHINLYKISKQSKEKLSKKKQEEITLVSDESSSSINPPKSASSKAKSNAQSDSKTGNTTSIAFPSSKTPSEIEKEETGVKIFGNPIMKNVIESQEPIDTVISCSNGKIGCHRIVLAAASPFVANLFCDHRLGETVILVLPDTSVKVMEVILQFCYTGQMIYPRESEAEIFEAMKCLLIGEFGKLSLTEVIVKKPATVPHTSLLEQISDESSDSFYSSSFSDSSLSDLFEEVRLPILKLKKTTVSEGAPTSQKKPSCKGQNVSRKKESRKVSERKDQSKQESKKPSEATLSKTSSKLKKPITATTEVLKPNNTADALVSSYLSLPSDKTDHTNELYSGIQDNEGKAIQCTLCPRLIPYPKKNFVKHLVAAHDRRFYSVHVPHTQMAKLSFCTICDEQYKSLNDAHRCLRGHNKTRCYVCFGVFDVSDIHDHYCSAHGIKTKYGIGIKCRWCELVVVCDNFKGFIKHATHTHNPKTDFYDADKVSSITYIQSNDIFTNFEAASTANVQISKTTDEKATENENRQKFVSPSMEFKKGVYTLHPDPQTGKLKNLSINELPQVHVHVEYLSETLVDYWLSKRSTAQAIDANREHVRQNFEPRTETLYDFNEEIFLGHQIVATYTTDQSILPNGDTDTLHDSSITLDDKMRFKKPKSRNEDA